MAIGPHGTLIGGNMLRAGGPGLHGMPAGMWRDQRLLVVNGAAVANYLKIWIFKDIHYDCGLGLLPMQIGLPGMPGALPAGAMAMPGMGVMLQGHPNMLQMMQPRFRWCLPAAPGLLQAPAGQPPTHLQPQPHPQHVQPARSFSRTTAALQAQAPLLSLPLPLLFHEWGTDQAYDCKQQTARTQQASSFIKSNQSQFFSMYNSFWDTVP